MTAHGNRCGSVRIGWDGVFDELVKKHGYTRSFGGMYHAAKRLGLGGKDKSLKRREREKRRYPELEVLGEKVQIDVAITANMCKMRHIAA